MRSTRRRRESARERERGGKEKERAGGKAKLPLNETKSSSKR